MAVSTPPARTGTISVVITTFKRPHLVGTAIESVLAQTRPPEELLVIDSSPDPHETRDVVARYPQARYEWTEDKGLSGGRNVGLELASGDYINFLDDDDWFLPGKLEAQAALMDADPGVDLVYCRLLRATDPETVIGEYLRGHQLPQDVVPALLRENFVLAHAPLIRRQRLLDMGGFDADPHSSEEYEGWIRLALHGARFAYCDEILAAVRVTPGSMSSVKTNLLRKMETGFRKNSERLKPYRTPDGREWWLAGPAYMLGRAALESGDAEAARRELRRALQHDPAHRHARLYLALASLPGPVRRLLLDSRKWKRSLVRHGVGAESRWA